MIVYNDCRCNPVRVHELLMALVELCACSAVYID